MNDRGSIRRPRRAPAVVCLSLLLGLGGCQPPAEPPAVESVPRPVPVVSVEAQSGETKLRFPGRVRAAQRAELAFNVPGFVAEFAIAEGEHVPAGTVVARLEDGVFRARVAAARAEFERTASDYERYRSLWERGRAVARMDLDDMASRLEAARTQLAAAEQDLADTELRAPFDGMITRRRVETFASVQSRQAVAEFQDTERLEVVIDVPERILRSETTKGGAIAVFEGQPDRGVPLTFKSFSAEADPQTQTYEVVLSLSPERQGLTVLPGMSATVIPLGDASGTGPGRLLAPLRAVTAGPDGQPRVWRLDDDDRVHPVTVVLGEISGDSVLIASGLQGGERIAVAALQSLREGMIVRPVEAR